MCTTTGGIFICQLFPNCRWAKPGERPADPTPPFPHIVASPSAASKDCWCLCRLSGRGLICWMYPGNARTDNLSPECSADDLARLKASKQWADAHPAGARIYAYLDSTRAL